MYRVRLTDAQREELKRRTHERGVKPRTRDRLEMVRLSDAGWSIPRIAPHLGVSESCVRRWIQRFLEGGFDALPDQPHVGQSSSLTPEMITKIRAEIEKGERTWSAAQVAEWTAQQFGVSLSADWLSRLLKRHRLSYQRTARSLRHKQDPQAVGEKAAELALLEKGRGERSEGPVPGPG